MDGVYAAGEGQRCVAATCSGAAARAALHALLVGVHERVHAAHGAWLHICKNTLNEYVFNLFGRLLCVPNHFKIV